MFPKNGLGPGRPWSDHRMVIEGMFWQLSTGAPWRDMPKEFGPWKTVYERYRGYRGDGTFDRIIERLQIKLDENGLIDWDLFCVDGSSVRAHRAAAGARKGGPRRTPRTSPRTTLLGVPAGAGGPSFTLSPTAKGRRLRSA
jgi:transposase